MPLRIFIALLFLGPVAGAQVSFVEIDSLILYEHLEQAERKTEALIQQLEDRESRKESVLEMKFRLVQIKDRQDVSPAKILEDLLLLKAEAKGLPSLSYRIHLLIALAYEKAKNLDLTKKYLDMAYAMSGNFESIFSLYCVRKSSYLSYMKEYDASYGWAVKARDFALKYGNVTDLKDAYLLLRNLESQKENYPEVQKYNVLLLDFARKSNSKNLALSYLNISFTYLVMQDPNKALQYSDSTYAFYASLPLMYKNDVPQVRYKIFESLGQTDSAYHYFKLYHKDLLQWQKEEELFKTKSLEEQYQNVKKEATIQSKNQQIFFIVSLLGVLTLGAVLLYRKNREIKKQNKTIHKQVLDLSKTLEQKQVLLSELQHRVKNNLQHVISILEIQKESVNYNNIDELIRGNQNRIHSMALLHKKLHVSDSVNEVHLGRYLAELAELVKDSYDTPKKNITLQTACEVALISIEKALPIGLIITELVSNSMKHAFKKQLMGAIRIELVRETASGDFMLCYSDNGAGFDFNEISDKGLGQEIIKGLIDQLNGTYTAKQAPGFRLTVNFR